MRFDLTMLHKLDIFFFLKFLKILQLLEDNLYGIVSGLLVFHLFIFGIGYIGHLMPI